MPKALLRGGPLAGQMLETTGVEIEGAGWRGRYVATGQRTWNDVRRIYEWQETAMADGKLEFRETPDGLEVVLESSTPGRVKVTRDFVDRILEMREANLTPLGLTISAANATVRLHPAAGQDPDAETWEMDVVAIEPVEREAWRTTIRDGALADEGDVGRCTGCELVFAIPTHPEDLETEQDEDRWYQDQLSKASEAAVKHHRDLGHVVEYAVVRTVLIGEPA